MQFICPHCGAFYKIDDETRLSASDGLVTCFRCKQVFLVEEITTPPDEIPPSVPGGPIPKSKRDGGRSAPSSPPPASPRRHQESPELTPEKPFTLHPTGDEVDRAPPLGVSNGSSRPPRRFATVIWGIGALILLLSAAGQMLWYSRSSPQAHAVLTLLCSKLGCKIEPLREPGAFRVTERVFLRDPNQPDLLSLQLRISNHAEFTQPYPGIELVLYDSTQAVIAKSRIGPEEYLGSEANSLLLESGASGTIKLYVPDPGPEATGFAIEFF